MSQCVVCHKNKKNVLKIGELPGALRQIIKETSNYSKEDYICNEDLIKLVKISVHKEMQDNKSEDKIINTLIEEKILFLTKGDEATFGQRAADKISGFGGSWKFIISFIMILFFWILLNTAFLTNKYDPYPFILLNLVLSCLAALQAPLIMMSQNRQAEIDRKQAANDFKTNLKAEVEIHILNKKLDKLLEYHQINIDSNIEFISIDTEEVIEK